MKFKFLRQILPISLFVFSFLLPFRNGPIGNRSISKMANGDLQEPRSTLKDIDINEYSLSAFNEGDEVNQIVICTSDKKKVQITLFLQFLQSLFSITNPSNPVNPLATRGLLFDEVFNYDYEYDKGTPDYARETGYSQLIVNQYKYSGSSGGLSLACQWYDNHTYYDDYNNSTQSFGNSLVTRSYKPSYSSSTYFASYNLTSYSNEYLSMDLSKACNTSSGSNSPYIDYYCFLWFYKPLHVVNNRWLSDYKKISSDKCYFWNAVGPSISLIASSGGENLSYKDGFNAGYGNGYSDGKKDGLNGNAYNEGYNQGRTDSNKEFYEKVDSLEKENSSLKSDKDSLQQEYNDYKTSYNDDVIANAKQEGYNNGLNSVTNDTSSIISLFGAITTIPLNILNGLASFSIWNTPVIYMIITFLFLACVFWCIKKFCF